MKLKSAGLFVLPVVLAALLLPICSLAQDRGQSVQGLSSNLTAQLPVYHALIIGINDYKYWQDLRRPREDAENLGALLKERYGFADIHLLLDDQATRKAIYDALEGLLKLDENSAILIFFAGHGGFNKALNEGYWVPAEAQRDSPSDYLENQTVQKYVSRLKARHVLVVSDSCFSGALLRGDSEKMPSSPDLEWYRRVIARPSRFAITSGDLESVPDESVFCTKLLNNLRYADQEALSAKELSLKLEKEIPQYSRQTVLSGRISNDPHDENGQFVFVLRTGIGTPGRVSNPPRVSAGPSEIQLYGKLVLKSSVSGTVAIDGAGDWRIESNKGLQWDRLDVGRHTVRVESGGKRWEKAIVVADGGTVSEMATFGAQPGGDLAVDLGNDVKMEFVWIEALKGWVGKYEVTNEEYRRFKADHTSGDIQGQSLNGERQPVVQVSYDDAVAFAEWINRRSVLPEGYKARLPDGKEWLTIAQCGDGREYPWGNEWPPKYGNYSGQESAWSSKIDGYNDGHPVSCDVGQSGINTWGLYGVGGNVWEWTSELYGTAGARVLRGASWYGGGREDLRCSCRFNVGVPSGRYGSIGFRLVVLR